MRSLHLALKRCHLAVIELTPIGTGLPDCMAIYLTDI